MMKRNKGYSLGVLIITIVVMLILTTTALISYRSLSKDRDITNFMNDIQEVQEYVKEYYAENRVLPIKYDDAKKPAMINTIEYEEIKNYTDLKETGNYYYIDLSKLERIHLKDADRGYIVNENSLNVYVMNGIEFEGTMYYTVTNEMKGNNKVYNENANFEVIVAGNPVVWSNKAVITLSIPNFENINADEWQFKYYTPGPITAEEFRTKGKLFLYGETVEITENGIVSFYVENIKSGDIGYAKTVNVVVSKIDDISPIITISGDRENLGEISIIDNETGINPDRLRYKIIGDDLNNPPEGLPLLTYGTRYKKYIDEYNSLKSESTEILSRINNLKSAGSGDEELQYLYADLSDIEFSIQTLNNNNRSFNDGDVPYSDTNANIAIYAYDYAENVAQDIEGVSRKVLLNSKLIEY